MWRVAELLLARYHLILYKHLLLGSRMNYITAAAANDAVVQCWSSRKRWRRSKQYYYYYKFFSIKRQTIRKCKIDKWIEGNKCNETKNFFFKHNIKQPATTLTKQLFLYGCCCLFETTMFTFYRSVCDIWIVASYIYGLRNEWKVNNRNSKKRKKKK